MFFKTIFKDSKNFKRCEKLKVQSISAFLDMANFSDFLLKSPVTGYRDRGSFTPICKLP